MKNEIKIVVAKSAGFCYGVKLAVEKTKKALYDFENVYSTGQIVHNTQIMDELKEKGLKISKNIFEIPEESSIIIRAHGVPESTILECEARKLNIIDTTCKNVKKIHEIVSLYSKEGYKIVIVGDKEHDEIEGIKGWIDGEFQVISSKYELNESYENVCLVAQTTTNIAVWEKVVENIKAISENCLIFDTICNATYARQEEAKKLAENSNTFFVIGDKKSANSNRLYEIAKEFCDNTYFVQKAEDIEVSMIKGENVGVTAGASTPDEVIMEIVEKIQILQKDYT